MPVLEQLSSWSTYRPADTGQRQVRMKSIFNSKASGPQRRPEVGLQRCEPSQFRTADSGPENLGAGQIRKRANALRRKLDSRMPGHDLLESGHERLDVRHGNVPKEMQRQMDAINRVGSNPVVKRFQSVDGCLQLGANRLGQLDGEENAPALGLTAGRRCQPSP